MADQIGAIDVPELAANGIFPLVSDYGYGYARTPELAVHRFMSANSKIEQRFVLGNGLKRYTVLRQRLSRADFLALRDFWEARHGSYEPFVYHAPSEDGQSTTDVTVRFDTTPLEFEHLVSTITSIGLTLIEVPDPATAPAYSVVSTVTRIPSSALAAALLSPVQIAIPLIKITVREPGYPESYLSDRRCTVGGQLYQARLLRWDGISQGMNGETDEATFVFGNADRVMRDLSFQTDLGFAQVDFSVFHVGTGIKLDLWSGRVSGSDYDEGPEFTIHCSDFVYELGLVYPPRVISPQCWKPFNSTMCPYTANGTPGFTTCPRSWPDCQARGMDAWFGGFHIDPERVVVKDNSTGTWGIGRRLLSPLSIVNEGAGGQALQEVYTDVDMPVNCIIAANRDDGDFNVALGIVGAGPIHEYSIDGLKHRLDGQSAHGPLPKGLRRSYGNDPALNNDPDPDSDKFGFSHLDPANPGGPYIVTQYSNLAGVAFVEVRRSDDKGLQLSRISEHQMQAWIKGGMKGYTWTAPGDRAETNPNVNPIWVAVNAILRSTGLHLGSAAEQEALIDIPSAVAAANVCNNIVNRADAVPGLTGTETQFKFRGVLADERTLRDWLGDILNCCLGYYVQSAGKIKFGIRVNSSALAAYTAGNVIAGTVKISYRQPQFNSLTVTFGDADYQWQPRPYTADDPDHQKMVGGAYPRKLKSQMNLVGCSTIAQAGRIAITRLREEIGGIHAAEWRGACDVALKTTILGLDTEVGMVCSLTHADAPGGYTEFRVQRWTLNSDWSITLQGRSTTDAMYNLVVGPKPADVTPEPVPAERHWDTLPPQPWFPYHEQPGASDPLWDETDWNFGLQQDYAIAADGTAIPKLIITGLYPVTQVLAEDPPLIGSISTAATGGDIASGKWVVIALTATDSNGNETRSSQPVAIPVAVGTNTNKVVLSGITWPANTTGYKLYAGEDHNRVSLQIEDAASQPASIDVTGYANFRTKGLPRPDIETLKVRVKISEHAGDIGLAVEAIGAGSITINGGQWTPDELVGRVVSFITDTSDGSAQIWNFTVTGNTPSVLSVTPDPAAAGVEAGDVMLLRPQATTFSATTIGDSMFQNWVYPSGMNPGEEVGRVVRIIHGTAVGHERRIAANDATTLTVDSPWSVIPDATSIFVVEGPAWEYTADAGRLANEVVNGQLSFAVPIDNFLGRTVTVEVVPVTRDGREPSRGYNVWREVYVYGDPGDVANDKEIWTNAGLLTY